ncbi:MAG: hypothetical protein WD038_05440 [Balneolales bacterium]
MPNLHPGARPLPTHPVVTNSRSLPAGTGVSPVPHYTAASRRYTFSSSSIQPMNDFSKRIAGVRTAIHISFRQIHEL